MKLFISTDMEGISSIVSSKEVTNTEQEYQRARHLMTKEVNGALKGAFAGGITEAVVADAHASMTNIIPEELDPRALLVRGAPRPLGMMDGLDASFSAVFCIGYHAMRGTGGGVLEHTYTGPLNSLKINGHLRGELGLNVYLAGSFSVPVVLVTGDDKVEAEALDLLGDVETVKVKEGRGRYAAISLHPQRALELIEEKGEKAIRRIKDFSPLTASTPVHLELTFNHSGMADNACLIPEVKRKGGCTVEYLAKDYPTAYQAFRAMISLAVS